MASSSQGAPLHPTFTGIIRNTMDALILFEACLTGQLNHVHRRPHDRERESLIRSGNVFIYEENASGIKRWTDGNHWSPSRILGNFLLYRELEKAFPPGEKKRANKRKKSDAGVGKPEGAGPRPGANGAVGAGPDGALGSNGKELERALVGSLVDSYPFKEDGLVKKTISVKWNGIPHHLVAYYTIADAQSGRLQTPRDTPELVGIIPRSGLIQHQEFRVPVDQDDVVNDDPSGALLRFMPLPRDLAYPGSGNPRAMSMPTMPGHMPYATAHGFHVPQAPSPMGGMVASLAGGYYMHPPQHAYVDPMRSQSTSMSHLGYAPSVPLLDNTSMNNGAARRHSASYDLQASPSGDSALSPLPTIPETRNMGGQDYFQSAYSFGHRQSSVAVSPGTELFETTRELANETLVSFDRSSGMLDLDDVERSWFSGELGNGQPQFIGSAQPAGWPRGVSRT